MIRIVATELPGAGGGLASAAAVAVALAADRGERPVLVAEVGGGRARGPTMLAAAAARALEGELRAAGHRCSSRGRVAWLTIDAAEGWEDGLGAALEIARDARACVAHVPCARLREVLGHPRLGFAAVLVRAELPAQRPLAALTSIELREAGLRVRIASRTPGRVATRRALAGIDPGGDASRRSLRLVRGLAGPRLPAGLRTPVAPPLAAESGQALPLVLGSILVLVFCTLALAALGGAVTGKSRLQRSADLVALSAARSMRDDFQRLFEPATLAGGSPNPAHLDRGAYLRRATAAAVEAARRNGVGAGRLRVRFPDRESFAPLRVRAELVGELELPASGAAAALAVHAVAEAVPSAPTGATPGTPGAPEVASGGGYAGPLAYRQGTPMRPDVAAAFDRLEASARAAGLALAINSGYRSDAEQAALWQQNPDPRWVAPPGTSLHRCATELDLGPPAAYGWLAANARRFGFLRRYAWEAWHYGFVDGPAPCSARGDAGGEAADGGSAPGGLPAFVPGRFRASIVAAAQRWNVSAALLAAQLLAESNFNPYAVSPAGAAGIAQFIPSTAAAYGLDDPFDAGAAIDAQAHLMAELLSRFGDPALALAAYNAGPGPVEACGCVPAIPETQGYVARILALIDGAGSGSGGAAPRLEVRLVD